MIQLAAVVLHRDSKLSAHIDPVDTQQQSTESHRAAVVHIIAIHRWCRLAWVGGHFQEYCLCLIQTLLIGNH